MNNGPKSYVEIKGLLHINCLDYTSLKVFFPLLSYILLNLEKVRLIIPGLTASWSD